MMMLNVNENSMGLDISSSLIWGVKRGEGVYKC